MSVGEGAVQTATSSLAGGGDADATEKDFVLFVNKEGRFSGDYEPLPLEDATLTAPQGPIDEETGEINWDCPCLQSALAPPCGEYFKAAFSCFVASKTEPKGGDCLEQFSAMQDCFRAHPEVYLSGREGADLENAPESEDPAEQNERAPEEQH